MRVQLEANATAARRRWIPCLSLWPGLAQIWSGQEWLGLILAAFFGLNLNAALLTSIVWRDAVPQSAVVFFFACCAATWASTLAYSLWWNWRCHPEQHRLEIDRLYRQSLESYLQGRWNEARRLCEQILARDEADTEALMQLALSHARLGEAEHARRALQQCTECDPSRKWRWEIDRELKRLATRA